MTYDLGRNYSARIDLPHVPEDQRHVHIEKNGFEVADQNEDGTPHHSNKKRRTNKEIKKQLKELGWDWDENERKQCGIPFDEIAREYESFNKSVGLYPTPLHGQCTAPLGEPVLPPIPVFS